MLHNTQRFLTKFVENKNLSLKDSYKMSVKRKPLDVDLSLSQHLYYTVCLLTFELLALATENFNQENLNFGDPTINTMLKEVKTKLPPEYKNMNGAEFLKLLRCSIAHNSAEIQNVYTGNIKQYDISLNKKGAPETQYSLPLEDILLISEAYDKCRNMSHPHGALDHPDCNSVKELLQKHKKLGSFDKFLTFYNDKGEIVPIDKYQDSAFLRFLLKHESLINKSKNFDHFLTRYFPCKNSKLNQYEHKYQLSMTCSILLDSREKLANIIDPNFKAYLSTLKREKAIKMTEFNITCNDMIAMLDKIDYQGALPYKDKDFLKSIMLSSVAFSICSSRTNDELYDLFKQSGQEMDKDTVRHIRNSFIHGRYFYNFNNSFEIYDGTNNLEHFATLSFDAINDIYSTYAHNQIVSLVYTRELMEYQELINKINPEM